MAYAGAEVLIGIFGFFFHDLFLALLGVAEGTLFPMVGSGMGLTILRWSLAILASGRAQLPSGHHLPADHRGADASSAGPPRTPAFAFLLSEQSGCLAGGPSCGVRSDRPLGLPGTSMSAAGLNMLAALLAVLVARRIESGEAVIPVRKPTGDEAETNVSASAMTAFDCFDRGGGLPRCHRTAGARRQDPSGYRLWHGRGVLHLRNRLDSNAVAGSGLGHAFLRVDAVRVHPWARDRSADHSREGRQAGRPHAGSGLDSMGHGGCGSHDASALPGVISGHRGRCSPPSVQPMVATRCSICPRYGMALAVMLPATILAGMTLPLITMMLVRGPFGERSVGWVYGVNTLGSIVGCGAGCVGTDADPGAEAAPGSWSWARHAAWGGTPATDQCDPRSRRKSSDLDRAHTPHPAPACR